MEGELPPCSQSTNKHIKHKPAWKHSLAQKKCSPAEQQSRTTEGKMSTAFPLLAVCDGKPLTLCILWCAWMSICIISWNTAWKIVLWLIHYHLISFFELFILYFVDLVTFFIMHLERIGFSCIHLNPLWQQFVELQNIEDACNHFQRLQSPVSLVLS